MSSPPGPQGEPLFGDGRRYADDPFSFLADLEDAYGDMARFEMGPIETYMINDPAAIERVLVADADRFRKPDFQGDALDDLLGDGLLLSEGDTWQRQRRLATPAFQPSRLRGMADRIVDHAESMVADWEPGETVDVERAMQRVTLDVILDLMMGVELSDERVREIQAALEPLGARFEPDPLRYVAPEWLPMPGDREFEEAVDTLEGVLDEIVAARLDTIGDPEADDGPMDFLSILVRARERGEQRQEQLRDELMTMLLAGHDTTALTLTYTWYLLADHPDAERRVHGEVDRVVGTAGSSGAGDAPRPGADDVDDLDHVERVIQESMRLYPPVFVLFREPTEDVRLCGYEVPEGRAVMCSQWAMHRSERFWAEPDRFDPDRFRAERAADRHNFAYFPFGGGPRHCIGKHLATLEAQLILATVAARYRLEYDGPEPTLRPSLTAHPEDGMEMVVRER